MQIENEFDESFKDAGFEKSQEPVISSRKKNSVKEQENILSSEEKVLEVKKEKSLDSKQKTATKTQSKTSKTNGSADKKKNETKIQKDQGEGAEPKKQTPKKTVAKAGTKKSVSADLMVKSSTKKQSPAKKNGATKNGSQNAKKEQTDTTKNVSQSIKKNQTGTTKRASQSVKKKQVGETKTKQTTSVKKKEVEDLKVSEEVDVSGEAITPKRKTTTKSQSKSSKSVDEVLTVKVVKKQAPKTTKKDTEENVEVDFESCLARFMELKKQYEEKFGTEENQVLSPMEPEKESEETSSLVVDGVETEKFQTAKEEPCQVLEVKNKSSFFKYFLGVMVIFGLCFVASLFTFNVVLTPIEVQGFSMYPTINSSAYYYYDENESCSVWKKTDIVYISKNKDVSNKDIVVIGEGKTPSGNQIIKRVIASPEDTLTFKVTEIDYEYMQKYFYVDIYLNGEKIDEPYITKQTRIVYNLYSEEKDLEYYSFNNTLVTALNEKGVFTISLGADEYFVMGDNRWDSTDSRMFGTVKKSEIAGKVVLLVRSGDDLFQAIWKSIFSVRLQIA